MSEQANDKKLTISALRNMKHEGEKVAVLTASDASFTRQLEDAGLDVLLVGDSLGMVVQGHASTLPVSLDDMVYHGGIVARARRRAFLVMDMPFMTYSNPEQALLSAARLMQAGGADMVKLEGGAQRLDSVRALTSEGVPVCAHLGLLPQSVNKLGGYRVQGRDPAGAERIFEDAMALEQAGADMLVLECVPAALAKRISEATGMVVIGIGAGVGCDGQVLVLYDMLGITPGHRPRFTHNFLAGAGDIQAALRAYVAAVKNGHFPAAEHSYD